MGAQRETRAIRRPIPRQAPVSEGRMALPTPFETKRKKAPSGTSSRVCDVQVAETKGFEPSRRFPVCTLSRGVPSTTRPRLRRLVYGAWATETRAFWSDQHRSEMTGFSSLFHAYCAAGAQEPRAMCLLRKWPMLAEPTCGARQAGAAPRSDRDRPMPRDRDCCIP